MSEYEINKKICELLHCSDSRDKQYLECEIYNNEDLRVRTPCGLKSQPISFLLKIIGEVKQQNQILKHEVVGEAGKCMVAQAKLQKATKFIKGVTNMDCTNPGRTMLKAEELLEEITA